MKCRACQREHDPLIRCEVFAATNAHLTASNKDDNASNAMVLTETRDDDVSGSIRTPGGAELSGSVGEVKQRWSRKSYNAYQREYMKVMRAVKSGRAELIGGRDG